jgi:hypothetical protein
MTQEDKQLLLADLCARLPYDVKVKYDNGIYNIDYISALYEEIELDTPDNYTIGISEIKPYLRPMSSITEEERLELSTALIYANMIDNTRVQIDWLNAHHFDYRGLIQKDLAISTEEFNPYKD